MKRLSIFFLFLIILTGLLAERLDVEGVKERAEAGNDESQIVLAAMYDQGVGVEQNFEDAFYWTSKSAFQSEIFLC